MLGGLFGPAGKLSIQFPAEAVARACELAWYDGLRTGLVAGLFAGLVVGYLLGRDRK